MGERTDERRVAQGGAKDSAWDDFERQLADYLATMVDEDDQDHLILELAVPEPDDGCAPYAQLSAFGGGELLRAEISGNHYLGDDFQIPEDGARKLWRGGWDGGTEEEPNFFVTKGTEEAADVARMTVRALRSVFHIPHPQLLGCNAWGPAAAFVDRLGLTASDDIPKDLFEADQASADGGVAFPAGRSELVGLVQAALVGSEHGDPHIDEDGDIVIVPLDGPVWIRVLTDQPTLVIMSRVVTRVRSRTRTSVELGVLNRDSLWVRWTLRERDVWQSITYPGMPFSAGSLKNMLGMFLSVREETQGDLALRTGGRS